MRILRSSSEDEMIAVFLRGELPAERYGAATEQALVNARADRRVVEEPDLSDSAANALRRRLLSEVRGYGGVGLFHGFPGDVRWEWAAFALEELMAVRYIEYSYWVELSGGTRLPTDGARRLREGVEPYGVPSDGFFELADELTAGARFSPLILVDGPSGLVVLEGHARLTAYALQPTAVPPELEVLVGTSPSMSRWALY
jgi:hypothetical protein